MTPSTETELTKPKSTIREKLLMTFHALVVLGGFLILFAAYWLGILFNAIFVLLLILVLGMAFSRVFGAGWKTLELQFFRRPFARAFRKYLLQWLNIGIFLILAGVTLRFAIVSAQFTPDKYRSMQTMIWGSVAVIMVFALIPHKRVRLSINGFFLVGWVFLGMELLRIVQPGSSFESVVLASPFAGDSYIFNGGRSTLINHHYPIAAQRYALDIIKTKKGRDVDGDESKLESYPAWGQILYAPADGEIVKVVNDRPDMEIGKADSQQIIGNHVVLDIGQGRFVLMAHLKKGSVRVSPGDKVKQGAALAECGNSGNTSAPHLHLQVQNHAHFHANDLRTFPILFRNVIRARSGRRAQLKETDVRRNDIMVASEVRAENSQGAETLK
jgi:hypothetical protein